METQSEPASLQQPTSMTISIGSVLNRAFSVLGKNPALFLGLSFIATFPTQLLNNLADDDPLFLIILLLIGVILGTVLQAVIAYGVFEVLRGHKVSMIETLTRGFVQLVPVLIASILMGLGITLGFFLLIVPGVILMLFWAVAIPACVVERLGPVASLKRSAELTKGFRGKILGLIIITALFVGIFQAVCSGILMVFLPQGFFLGIILGLVLTIPQAFQAIVYAIIYFDLRTVKEGLSLESLAKFFD